MTNKPKYSVPVASDTEYYDEAEGTENVPDETIAGMDAETVKRKLKEVKSWKE